MEDKKFRTFIKGVLILFIIGFLYSLSFTYVTYYSEKKAQENGSELSELYRSDQTINDSFKPWGSLFLKKYSFKEAKRNSLNLGLDLRGGMSILLEISQRNILETLSAGAYNKKEKQTLLEALNASDIIHKGNSQKNYLDVFRDEFNKIIERDTLDVTLYSIFQTEEESLDFDGDILSPKERQGKVIEYLRVKSADYIDKTFETIKRRIDQFGLANPTVKRIEASDRILVELPGMTDEEMVKTYLAKTASLEFWKTKKITDLPFLTSDTVFLSFANLPGRSPDDSGNWGALTDQMAPDLFSSSDAAIVNVKNTDEQKSIVKKYLDSKYADGTLDESLVFYFTSGPSRTRDINGEKNALYEDYVQLIALVKSAKYNHNGPLLLGKEVNNAQQTYDQASGRPQISMSMTGTGTADWARITEEEIGNQVAVVLDEIVYTYPNINEKIPSGSSVISGNFDVQEAQDVASILNAGKLDAKVDIVGSEYVGPSLGQKSIEAGYKSFLLALLFVLIYMLFYYFHAGVASNLGLIINMFFIFGALSAFNATLTLPGIAGIVLTIGMAVDANVLIYERIKEELSQQKGLALAIRDGYKNAYSAIIDANLTTLLTAVVLFYFGSGPIKGFATTLIIGILTSLFCAIFVTRLVFEYSFTLSKECRNKGFPLYK